MAPRAPQMKGEFVVSEQATGATRGRRTAVVILGSLMAGAALGAGAVVSDHSAPIRDQFREAFTAGAREVSSLPPAEAIVVNGN